MPSNEHPERYVAVLTPEQEERAHMILSWIENIADPILTQQEKDGILCPVAPVAIKVERNVIEWIAEITEVLAARKLERLGFQIVKTENGEG
jgi:hypothetical protein